MTSSSPISDKTKAGIRMIVEGDFSPSTQRVMLERTTEAAVDAAVREDRKQMADKLRAFRVWENAWELAATPSAMAAWIESGGNHLPKEKADD